MDKSKSANPPLSGLPADRLVYLVSDDFLFAEYFAQQIVHFGYFVQHVRDVKSLPGSLADQNSVAIIIDIRSTGDQPDHKDIFEEIAQFQQTFHNLIFMSDHDDQTVRLKSIRIGGIAMFTKPVNIINMIDKLDALTRSSMKPQPYKILILENQHAVASYYQMVLKMSGMDAQIVLNPNNFIEQMREFHPDLILMDTFLSEINAAELAKAVRQMDDFVSIPIIFLSTDDDFGKRIEALDLGGDDYLVKPIKAAHLMAIVRSRLERSKTLRSYMIRDSLTNLLNHTAFRNVLTHEVSRCKRQSSPLALAMLDIDHFKMVNDTYGHAMGDNALKGLSRLLKQRLRKMDVVGRYGGDEFTALLVDCEADQAMKIMDEIRVHFTEIEFTSNQAKLLSLSFSCGIATFPKYQTVESLTDSADQALYIAKASRRNQIIIAQQ
jgi:diguanylate cyclase (GGDEF)-like protein